MCDGSMSHTTFSIFWSRLRNSKSRICTRSFVYSSSQVWNTVAHSLVVFSKSSKEASMSHWVLSTLSSCVERSLLMASISLSALFSGYLLRRI